MQFILEKELIAICSLERSGKEGNLLADVFFSNVFFSQATIVGNGILSCFISYTRVKNKKLNR